MTVTDTSLTSLLSSLTESLTSATSVLSANSDRFLAPQDGISLLDVKTELLLSYLQNLAFLVLFKIRNGTSAESPQENLHHNVVEKLIELRVYLERGVRPIEQRLKYTIDQYLQAAANKKNAPHPRPSTGHRDIHDSDISDDEDDSDADLDQPPTHDPTTSLADAAHAPRLTSLALPSSSATATATKPTSSSNTTTNNTSIYKPPRHAPTSMPTSDPSTHAPTTHRRAHKSALLNEYITSELSSAPIAQPSIGSNNTILAHGRTGLSARDQARERERTEYEERNFTRLPGESKAEKRKARKQERDGGRRDMFGGEDWTGLGGLGEGISRSVARGKGDERDGKLKRREKRRATEDAPRGDGMGGSGGGIGESFEKRRKVLAGRAERKGGKRR